MDAVFKQGDVLAVVESVKAASDIIAPMSGTIMDTNHELETTPQLLNSAPYGSGWIAKIKVTQPTEFEKLLTEQQYQDYLITVGHE